MTRELVDHILKRLALVLLVIWGIYWPIAYYTRNEAIVASHAQLSINYQQLQQQATAAVQQLQGEIQRLKEGTVK